MTKPTNPFVYGVPVGIEKFIGRLNEINRIFDQLNSHTVGSVAINGERRIGKTSLLRYISDREVFKRWNIDENKFIFIFQDCETISPFTRSHFWQVILRKLHRWLKRNHADSNLIDAAQELSSQEEISIVDVEFLFEDLNASGFLLILILDEFEWCVHADTANEAATRDFLAGLRSLVNHVPRTLSLLVATRLPLDEVCKDVRFMGSPFYNNFVFVYLHPFSRDEAGQLIKRCLSNTGITFFSSEIDFVCSLAGTHPLLLQTASALVFKSRTETGKTDISAIRKEFQESVKHQLEEFWDFSTSKMQQILTLMASEQEAKAVALLETCTNERNSLLQRGLIYCENGTYQLFSPVFKDWLTLNFYRLEVEPWLEGEQTKTSDEQPTVFISYSHKDEKEKDALVSHLGVLQKGAGLIDLWSDDRIGGGDDWEEEIRQAMEKAKIAILLVSANFLTSGFILGTEVPTLLQRRKKEGIIVLPIIAKHCAWLNVKWLAKMNVRPKNGNPIWRKGAEPDEELAAIAGEVANKLKSIRCSER
jgi:hypothetical protein